MASGARKSTAIATIAIANLEQLDAVEAETLALFCWADVRPLRGVAGLVDWRMCGGLSRAIAEALFGCVRGEVLLMPATGRWGFRRMFIFGLGEGASAAERRVALSDVAGQAASVLQRAGVKRAHFVAPALGVAEEDAQLAGVLSAAVAGNPTVVSVLGAAGK